MRRHKDAVLWRRLVLKIVIAEDAMHFAMEQGPASLVIGFGQDLMIIRASLYPEMTASMTYETQIALA